MRDSLVSLIRMKNPLFVFLLFLVYSCNENVEEKIPAKQTDSLPDTIAKINSGNKLDSSLSYLVIKERPGVALENDSLKKIINSWLAEKNIYGKSEGTFNIDSVADFILGLTRNQLAFSFGKCDADPRLLVKNSKANCVGYAAFFNSLMNYAIEQSGLKKKYKCHHYVGKIFFEETNVNALFANDPFFKDHDFNIVKSLDGGKDIAVDPSLYEYLGIKRIAIRKQ
jgi:hypothetical protein